MGRILKLLWGTFHKGNGGRGRRLEGHEGSSQGFIKGEGDSKVHMLLEKTKGRFDSVRGKGDLTVLEGKETVPQVPWGVGG